jgi:SRSO17 transposase
MTLHPATTQQVLGDVLFAVTSRLRRIEQRASFALYVRALLTDLPRKSAEPIAAWAAGRDPEACERHHDHLLHFLNTSPWDDRDVRLAATDVPLDELLASEPLDAYIVDDTGFLKQGNGSVGVQRQYTGSAGKIANCQIAVSLTAATRTTFLPLDLELYLPESWTQDEARCRKAKVPEHVRFRTKHDIALDLLAGSLVHGRPDAPVLADAAYGNASPFRGGVTAMGLTYAVGVNAPTTVRVVGKKGRLSGERSVEQVARSLRRSAWQPVAWWQGSQAELSSRFALIEVEVAQPHLDEPVRQHLLIEWPEGDKEPTHYTLATVRCASLKELVRLVKSRWKTERVYEDLKGELGLDHFEGRSWIGWQHHVSAVLASYAAVVTCQVRGFPPSARGPEEAGAEPATTGAARGRLVRVGASCPGATDGGVAA